MTKIFFATAADIVQIWRWLFDTPGMVVFEAYSQPDQPNKWFDTWEKLESYLAYSEVGLAAWPRNAGGEPQIEKISFKPELRRKLGGKGRSALRGPATIQIGRNNDQNGCLASGSISFWTEKGVRDCSIFSTEFIDEVDWPMFRSITGKIQRQIAKAAPAKMLSYPILPDAFEQLTAGRIRLWNWGEPVSLPSALIAPR